MSIRGPNAWLELYKRFRTGEYTKIKNTTISSHVWIYFEYTEKKTTLLFLLKY